MRSSAFFFRCECHSVRQVQCVRLPCGDEGDEVGRWFTRPQVALTRLYRYENISKLITQLERVFENQGYTMLVSVVLSVRADFTASAVISGSRMTLSCRAKMVCIG